MKVICVANQKGGIGKTTTATAIASILTDRGIKTLLIDADPQGNSTDSYRAKILHTATLYDVILDYDDPLDINAAIQHTESGDIIASDPLLATAETSFRSTGEEYFRLKDALERLTGYDFVIIDTAPADNKLLKNCLISADYVVIPTSADRFGLFGLTQLVATIRTIKKRQNPNLTVSGLLFCKYHANYALSREVEQDLDSLIQKLDIPAFKARIRESTVVQQAQAERIPLIQFKKTHPVTQDYITFIDELLKEVR